MPQINLCKFCTEKESTCWNEILITASCYQATFKWLFYYSWYVINSFHLHKLHFFLPWGFNKGLLKTLLWPANITRMCDLVGMNEGQSSCQHGFSVLSALNLPGCVTVISHATHWLSVTCPLNTVCNNTGNYFLPYVLTLVRVPWVNFDHRGVKHVIINWLSAKHLTG